MNLREKLPRLALMAALALPAFPALAQPAETGGGSEPPAKVAGQKDHAALAGLWAEHWQKSGPLRDQLWAKKMEYEALTRRGGDFKMAEVKALTDEMVRLKAQLRAERQKFFERMKAQGLSGAAFFGPDGQPGRGCGGSRFLLRDGHEDWGGHGDWDGGRRSGGRRHHSQP